MPAGGEDGGAVTARDGGASTDDGGTPASDGGGACTSVSDCPRGQGCLSGRCRDVSIYECRGDLAPIVQVEPTTLDFGSVRVGVQTTRNLRIRNLGSCNLQLSEVSLDTGVSPEFTCDECRPRGTWPVTLVPFDSKTIVVSYLATDAAPDMGSLSIVSTDPQFPLVRVPMKSSTKDAPRIFVEPAILDFGYVPVGMTKQLTFNITNSGGQTPLLVRTIENDPLTSQNYVIDAGNMRVDGGVAYVNSGGTPLQIKVTYRPQTLDTHNESIRIASTDPQAPQVVVQVKGYSVTPPAIRVSPTDLNFGDVVVGTRRSQPVTIENTGGGPLNLQMAFAPLSSTAFSFNPTGLPAIPGGQRATLYVDFFPTTTGIQQNRAILNITHNAQGTQTPVAITMVGNGTPSTGDDVLALEMTFENGDDAFWGSDLRDVDLYYDNQNLQTCSKQIANASWGNLGQCQWIGIGPRQEPERIVHSGGTASETAQTFSVKALYVEDCQRLPTQLISALTGLALDVVLQYLAGGIVPAGAGSTIANAILSNCLDREASNAQIKAYVNGTLVTSRTVRLGARGDLVPVFTVTRQNGRFTIR